MTRLVRLIVLATSFLSPVFGNSQSTDGIQGLADRLFGGNSNGFEFLLTTENDIWSRWNHPSNDNYTVSVSDNGKIHVQGTTLSALARG